MNPDEWTRFMNSYNKMATKALMDGYAKSLFMGPDDPWDEDTEKIDIGDDLRKALEEERKKSSRYSWSPWLEPVCECGVHKTYGKNAPKEFHSEWCNMRKR